jgi:hypothetical protein
MNRSENTNTARMGKSLNVSGNVYPFSVNILTVVDNITKVDAYLKSQRTLG